MKNMAKICIMTLLGLVIMPVSVSCLGGVSQSDYDSIVAELTDARDEITALENDLEQARSVETQGVESSLKYQDLEKDYNALVAEFNAAEGELAALSEEHEELESAHETLQAQNDSNINQINLLQTENTQLRAQLDVLTPPFPSISAGEVEQALLDMINQERTGAGLGVLTVGKNLREWSRTNSQAMSVAKHTIFYDDNWVPYQLHFIAGGYNTLADVVAGTMIIWKSNILSFNNNILADDVAYAGVSVVKTEGIFYITYMASNFP